MSVTLINPFVVPAADADAFVETWLRTANSIYGEPGFISATLHQALHPEARFSFVNVAPWESEALYRAAFTKNSVKPGQVRSQSYPALYKVAKIVTAG